MNEWALVYDGFEPDREGLREALCTLGNGYFATRGAALGGTCRRGSLPRHVHRGLLQPTAHRDRGTIASRTRTSSTRPTGCRCRSGSRRRVVRRRSSRAARLSPRARPSPRGAHARRCEPATDEGRITGVTERRFVDMAQPHLGCAPDDDRARELVWADRGAVGARRHGHEPRRRALPRAARRSPAPIGNRCDG